MRKKIIKIGLVLAFSVILIILLPRGYHHYFPRLHVYRIRGIRVENITIDDIAISVKTTERNHRSRVKVIMETWWNQAKKQTYFFTDGNDKSLRELTGGRVVNTHCGKSHSTSDLNCKTENEFSHSVKKNKRWWCHFDDDIYVNIDRLVDLLSEFNSSKDYYLGKHSLGHPWTVTYKTQNERFQFGTGGGGVCVSHSLAQKMIPLCSDGKFRLMSMEIKSHDDVTLAFIITIILKVELLEIPTFHSHLEKLSDIPEALLPSQIVLSTGIKVEGFSQKEDPTRFLSLHCLIHPDLDWCSKRQKLIS